ncbi:tRNA lysidine(34) synthetase TilS [Tsuneonella sp. HG222]
MIADEAARFEADLRRLLPAGGKIGLAVSGGPDSLAMLLLAHAAIPETFEVATVDHGLRAEAAQEAEFVKAVCAARGAVHATLPVVVGQGNVQSEARLARYASLAVWARERGLDAIATAHHADDQAETLLLRLNRGSGVAGLAGVRARGNVPGSDLPLVRPLLGWRRAELAALVDRAGMTAVVDPSNADERFDRVRMRRALAGADWLDPRAVAASAACLADADQALDWAAEQAWNAQVTRNDDAVFLAPGLPRAIALRIVARIMAEFNAAPRGGDVARLVDALDAGSAGTLGGVAAKAGRAGWEFRRAPPRRT